MCVRTLIFIISGYYYKNDINSGYIMYYKLVSKTLYITFVFIRSNSPHARARTHTHTKRKRKRKEKPLLWILINSIDTISYQVHKILGFKSYLHQKSICILNIIFWLKKKKNLYLAPLRASPMASLKPILEYQHPKNPLQQLLYLYFLE